MRIESLILCTILVLATAAPKPGSYSSRQQYQFQRSASSYRNNELQHKEEEAGRYGRIEDPEKYDKPLEQSQYQQASYHAPGDDDDDTDNDDSSEGTYSTGVKGHQQPNAYGSYHLGGRRDWSSNHQHSASYHGSAAHFGQGVIDSDYTTGDSYYQPGHGHYPSGGGEFHHTPEYHHHHHHHGHGSTSQSTSQTNTQNKDDQSLISLDQTYDYSKFKDHGFGKEYLENTEGQQRGTTPKSVRPTTENVRPVFETTDAVPNQPASENQMGDNGRTIPLNTQDQFTIGQTMQQGQSNMGQTFQQGQSTLGQTFQQGQSTLGQTFQQGQTNRDQSNMGQTFQQGQSNLGQTFQQGQTNRDQSTSGQTFQQGQNTEDQTVQQSNDDLKSVFEQIDQVAEMEKQFRDQTNTNQDSGRNYQTGHGGITHHTTGYIKPKPYNYGAMDGSYYGRDYSQHHHSGHDEVDCQHKEEHHKEEKVEEMITEQRVEEATTQQSADEATTEQSADEATTEQSADEATTQQALDENNGMETMNQEKQEEMGQGNLEEITETPEEATTVYYDYTQKDYGKMEYGDHHKEHEKHEEDLTQQHTQDYDKHIYDQQTDDGKWNYANQKNEDMSQQHQDEDLTQQHQDAFGKFEFGQNQDDLTQQTQDSFGKIEFGSQQHGKYDDSEDLTQQQQQPNGWSQIDVGNHKNDDMTQQQQQQQKYDDEFGHLEFGGQQKQEDLSQKTEGFERQDQHGRTSGSNYNSGSYGGQINSYGYSTASSRTHSASSSSSSYQNQYHSSSGGSSGYGSQHSVQIPDEKVEDLKQHKEDEQFAGEVHDIGQQVQKVEHLNLEAQKETPFEPEETAVVVEEKITEKPGFWRRIGGSISSTYESAKEKTKNLAEKVKHNLG